MQIILTHEQADFDALASQLGAYLLDNESIPVLPSRLNRNLRAFLMLYGTGLPFIERRDLPQEPIDRVTLVDTQSISSIKGMNDETEIQIIDHHPPRIDLPESWLISTDETGANTTLFVEELNQRGVILNPIQATLLLLGIYEDTGSLTYSRTTARDLRAAAYLVDQGASISLANDFLNHPLTLEQEKLFQKLQKDAESHIIHGHTIIVTCGDSRDIDEELSTIAHKLRNVMEPDALFLLIQIRGGVQFISRSTDDHIDVSKIAIALGGGGHPRAAAALIKNSSIEHVYKELMKLLPEYIQPAITVAELMSRGPQVLTSETPALEALKRMQRFGYEGYPVVAEGKLVGLLTRRAVDRAVAHKLNLTAGSIMQAGSVTVQPEDSIEHLQNLMTETGWGQIPVVHPNSGEIIGIVTRTDLLKTLSNQYTHISRKNFSEQLEAFLPPARLALLKMIAEKAHKQHYALYIVGGFVRDLILEQASQDLDLVVEGDAIALAHTLQEHFGGKLTSHGRFGTAKWQLNEIREALSNTLSQEFDQLLEPENIPDFIDLITARTEFYTHPTALPTIERGSIKLDLHRRDFTINTLALRLDGMHYGELHDYWGGLNDLNHGLVRVLHSISFVDDPTRMLRAVRYEQRYNFTIEPRTLQLLLEARSLLERVSGERIRHELDHVLDEENREGVLKRLQHLELLQEIDINLIWDHWLENQFAKIEEPLKWDIPTLPRGYPIRRALFYTIWLIRLQIDNTRTILKKIVYPGNIGNQIISAGRIWQLIPDLNGLQPSQVTVLLDPYPPLAIYAAYLATDDPKTKHLLENYYQNWRHVTPYINGHDLRKRGVPTGPKYQNILNLLRHAWLDGEITSAKEEEQLLEQLLSEE